MTCLSAKFCKHAKDCDIHMCSNTIEKCRAFNRKPNNNEEYLKSCTTEQLAWMISLFVGNAIAKHDCGNDEDIKPIKWVAWLKQPFS